MRFTLGIAQMTPRLGDVSANLELVLERTREARSRGVDLLVFPELALTGYFVKDLVPDVALHAGAPELAALAEASRDLSLVVGFAEETPEHRFFNSAAWFEGGRLSAVHRKVYLPTYGMFDEERYFSRGETVRAFDTRFGRAGLLVCEDYWHLPMPYLLAMDGAQLLVGIAASPGRGLQDGRPQGVVASPAPAPRSGAVAGDESLFSIMDVTRSFVRVWAKLLSVYFVFANRTGFEDGVNFWGGSMVIGPDGAAVATAPDFDETLLVVPMDTDNVRRERVVSGQLGDEDPDLTLRELDRIIRERRGLAAGDLEARLPAAP